MKSRVQNTSHLTGQLSSMVHLLFPLISFLAISGLWQWFGYAHTDGINCGFDVEPSGEAVCSRAVLETTNNLFHVLSWGPVPVTTWGSLFLVRGIKSRLWKLLHIGVVWITAGEVQSAVTHYFHGLASLGQAADLWQSFTVSVQTNVLSMQIRSKKKLHLEVPEVLECDYFKERLH